MRAIKSLAGGLVFAMMLAACAHPAAVSSLASPSQPMVAAEVTLPLDKMPAQSFTVPHMALRAPSPITAGNSGTLCVSASETLPALKALIAGAHESIYFETFNFGNDSMGQQIYPLLVAKAKSGVKVKVVCDYMGTHFLRGYYDMRDQLQAAGVDFRLYAPRTIVKDDQRVGINITHRKVYLADGTHALIGGVNLMQPFDTTTQDVLVDWHGPIVATAYKEFGLDWRAAGGGALHQVVPTSGAVGNVQAQIIVTSPPEGRYEARDTIIAQVKGAQSEILIENQYLWDVGLMQALKDAVKRGVTLRVIVPGDEDHGVYKLIHSDVLKELTGLGAQARLYNAYNGTGHLHVKYFGIDRRWVACGSANGDTRGFMDNQELDTAITDPTLAADFQTRLFEHDWSVNTKPFVYKPSVLDTNPFSNLLQILEYYM
jgi:cardiolipin synthase